MSGPAAAGRARPRTRLRAGRAALAAGVLTLALALAGSLAAPAESPAAAGHRGVTIHALWDGPKTFDRALDLAKAAGVRTVRVDMAWFTLEEGRKGEYRGWYVRRIDTFLSHARARGIRVIVDFWGSPCWASSAPDSLKQRCSYGWWSRGVERYAPNNPDDYASAAAFVARRWGSRLAAIEIWNEPNHEPFMRNSDRAHRYARMVRAAYPRIKAHAPRLPVLAGATAGGDTSFLKQLYRYGIKGHYDGISIHPYDAADPRLRPGGRFLISVPPVRRLMVAQGEGSKGLWLTEAGFSTCRGDSRCVPTERRQAAYTEGVVNTADRYHYVKAVLVYNFRNTSTDPYHFEGNFGLVRRDFTKKPGFWGLRRAMG